MPQHYGANSMANEIKFVHDDRTGIALIVTDEIKKLYASKNVITVSFDVKYVSEPKYRVVGLGNAEGGYSIYAQDIWDATGGAEGSLIYYLSGDIVSPAKWKDYKCTLDIDSWINSVGIREKGYLGNGWVSDKKVFLNLFVNPHTSKSIFEHISKSIHDKIYTFTLRNFLFGPEKTRVVCHIFNLHITKYVQENGEIPPVEEGDQINFDIIGFVCQDLHKRYRYRL
jgi:hypothetical protein